MMEKMEETNKEMRENHKSTMEEFKLIKEGNEELSNQLKNINK